MFVAVAALVGAAWFPGEGHADDTQLRASRDSAVVAGKGLANVGVTLDFARIVAFEQPARTVVIGNPAIVDGTLSDEHTIILTGKSIGTTNMIVLGESGREIASLAISVFANSNQVTTVYSGTEQTVYSCSETCRPLPTVVGK
jgi:Flp pilus assembly secretin CpaC